MDIYTIIYFMAMIVEMAIRAPLDRKRRREKISERRVTAQEKTLLGLLFLGMLVVPLIYAATDWLAPADYAPPAWAGWLGVVILSGALFIFWRAHADLGINWSPTLEIREKHELVTRGFYGLIRHPMYASQFLWVTAQPLLLQNWVAGFIGMLTFVPFYFLRVRSEEKMMIETFGDPYRKYMQRVGAIIPKLGR